MSHLSQLNDLRSYSRHWLGEFIDLYRNEECLWQPKHPDYSNHTARNSAYDRLVEKLKEVEPNPDRTMVVRKINSLRSAFRREYRKINTKSDYETRLWYYDKLLFIADQKPKRISTDCKPPKRSLALGFDDDDSMEFEADDTHSQSGAENHNTNSGEIITTDLNQQVTLVKSEEHHHQQQPPPLHHATHIQHGQPQHTTAVKVLEITSLDSNSQREIQQAVNSLEQHQMQQQLQQQAGQSQNAQITQIHHQQVPTIQFRGEHLPTIFGSTYTTAPTTTTTNRQDDEYDAIGINVASKLRNMNPTQRIIAEKLISDVLFNGQLDSLSINSTLTN